MSSLKLTLLATFFAVGAVAQIDHGDMGGADMTDAVDTPIFEPPVQDVTPPAMQEETPVDEASVEETGVPIDHTMDGMGTSTNGEEAESTMQESPVEGEEEEEEETTEEEAPVVSTNDHDMDMEAGDESSQSGVQEETTDEQETPIAEEEQHETTEEEGVEEEEQEEETTEEEQETTTEETHESTAEEEQELPTGEGEGHDESSMSGMGDMPGHNMTDSTNNTNTGGNITSMAAGGVMHSTSLLIAGTVFAGLYIMV